jgi:voltage-gated potassium channel
MSSLISFGTKQYVILCYLIGQVSILSWLYPPPQNGHGIYIQILDLIVLFGVTIGIVYEWFKILTRLTIKQAVLFMLCIVIQVVELFALSFYIIFCFDEASFVVSGADIAHTSKQLLHHGYEFLYYSVTTFTGTGYGDVTPVSAIAKEFASCEMLAGWIISTLMMALLGSKISLFFFHRRRDI